MSSILCIRPGQFEGADIAKQIAQDCSTPYLGFLEVNITSWDGVYETSLFNLSLGEILAIVNSIDCVYLLPGIVSDSSFYDIVEHINNAQVIDLGNHSNKFTKFVNTNKHFCVLPWIHHFVGYNAERRVCCSGGIIKDNSDLEQIRKQMLANKPVAQCNDCYVDEQQTGTSFRRQHNSEWRQRLNLKSVTDLSPTPVFYDIRSDSLCNLQCRSCNPSASTQVYKEYQLLNWAVPSVRHTTTIFDSIDYDNVIKVLVAGGEPTLMPEFKEFLKRAIANDRTDIDLSITTNGTNLNKEFIALVSKFKHVQFTVSIDGFAAVNKYLRWPSDWGTVISNLHKLYSITRNISINITASVWNITRLSDLVFFLEREFTDPNIMLHPAVPNKVDISPWVNPLRELIVTDLTKLRSSKTYAKSEQFRQRLDYFISSADKFGIDSSALEKFFEYNDALDRIRGVKLIDYIPELEQCRAYPTKPTYNTNAE